MRVDGNPVASLESCDACTDLFNRTAELMAQGGRELVPGNWMWHGRDRCWTSKIFMNIYAKLETIAFSFHVLLTTSTYSDKGRTNLLELEFGVRKALKSSRKRVYHEF
jgi:hypothetical protein